MALNIKNRTVERLAAEVAEIAGESKTQAIRRSLEERLERLTESGRSSNGASRHITFLEQEIWADIPPAVLGKQLSKTEIERVLGLGPDGV
jgi:antitoxin VapB